MRSSFRNSAGQASMAPCPTLTALAAAAAPCRICGLVKHHAVGVNQELVLWTGYASTHMGENQVAHAVGGNQAIRCRQVNPQLPLLGADDFF